MVKSSDKREDHRAPLGTKISWSPDNEKWYEDSSENISSTGMMLWTKRPLNEGSSIKLRFWLPNLKSQGPITVNAEVVRVVQRHGLQIGLGLKFHSLHSGNYERVNQFVRRILGLSVDNALSQLDGGNAGFNSFKIEHLTRKAEAEGDKAEKKSATHTQELQRRFTIRRWTRWGIKAAFLAVGLLIVIKAADLILALTSRL